MAHVFGGLEWLTLDQLHRTLGWSHSRARYYVDVFRTMLDAEGLLRRGTKGASGLILLHPSVLRIFDRVQSEMTKHQLSVPMAFVQMYGGKAFDILEEDIQEREKAIAARDERIANLERTLAKQRQSQKASTSQKQRGLMRKLADVLSSDE